MASYYHLLAASAVLLVILVGEGFALDCVQCNSFREPLCDSDPKQFAKPCKEENATSCRKMEQEIYYEDDYQTRTIRQCAVESGPMECIERTGTYRFKVWYCHCQGDNCNSASSLSVSLVVALLSSAVALLFKL